MRSSDRCSLLVVGYGIEAKPRLPVGVAHLEDGTLIFGPVDAAQANAQASAGGIKNVLLKPGPAGGRAQMALGKGMETYDAVLEQIAAADHPPHWAIATDDYVIRWPARLTLRADGDPKRPFELALGGTAAEFLCMQGRFTGPDQIPRPEQLVGPGMEMVGQGDVKGADSVIWFELGYEHRGASWRQRFYYLPFGSDSIYVLRAQATEPARDKMIDAADSIAGSFRPRA